MAQYLFNVLHDSSELATDEEMTAIRAFNEQIQADGHWVFAAGLAGPDTSTVVDGRHSEPVALYDQLVRLDPSPIVRLNRAIALAELDGPEVALAELAGLPLEDYHAYHAARADLLRRLGRSSEARAAYDRAVELTGNAAEAAYLARRRDQLAR